MFNDDYQDVNNVNNLCDFSHELRPSTSADNRISSRRSAIKPSPPRKKTIAICVDCHNSIYIDDFFRSCDKCHLYLCKICLEKNTNCVNCNFKLVKNNPLIPIKYSRVNTFFYYFCRCFFCNFSR